MLTFTMDHDVAVLIGRFQPIHERHLCLGAAVLLKANRLLLLQGRHRCAPDSRNP